MFIASHYYISGRGWGRVIPEILLFLGHRSLTKNKTLTGGGVRPFPKTLTLFMTKICDISYPIYDLTKNSKPYQ